MVLVVGVLGGGLYWYVTGQSVYIDQLGHPGAADQSVAREFRRAAGRLRESGGYGDHG